MMNTVKKKVKQKKILKVIYKQGKDIILNDVDSGIKNEDHLKSQAKHFEKYYKRMEPVIFNEANAKTKKQFNKCLKNVILANL